MVGGAPTGEGAGRRGAGPGVSLGGCSAWWRATAERRSSANEPKLGSCCGDE
jgi:hypothetical protein